MRRIKYHILKQLIDLSNIFRFGHKLVTIGNKMFAIGGRNEKKVIDSIEEFDHVEG